MQEIQEKVTNLKEENRRLRMELAIARAMVAESGSDFMLSDAVNTPVLGLNCKNPIVTDRVTVIIPAFNAQEYIARAISSVWSQTIDLNCVELIVIDDGSCDQTLPLCRRLAKTSPVRMRILTHENRRNLGVSATRQLGCSEATGEFVALLDADDLYLPDRLSASLHLLNCDDDVQAVCSLGINVDMEGQPVFGHNGSTLAGDWLALGEGIQPPFTFDQLWHADPIANSSLTIRRSALEKIGGYPKLMAHQAEDWLVALKLSLLNPIPCIDRKLIHYTHHEQAYTTSYNQENLHEGARIEVFYHLVWWMLHSQEHANQGANFFRRFYPRLISAHQHLLPMLRDYVMSGGHATDGLAGITTYVDQLYNESMALRRVLTVKTKENRIMRELLADGNNKFDDRVRWLYEEVDALRRVVKVKTEENKSFRNILNKIDNR